MSCTPSRLLPSPINIRLVSQLEVRSELYGSCKTPLSSSQSAILVLFDSPFATYPMATSKSPTWEKSLEI